MRIFGSSCGDILNWAGVLTEWSYSIAAGSVASGVAGATGNCFVLNQSPFSYADGFVRKNLPTAYSRLIEGFRFKTAALPSSGYRAVAQFWDNAANLQCGLWFDAAGRLSMWMGDPNSGGSQIGSFTVNNVVIPNTWLHIGLDITFSNAGAGSVTLYVNCQTITTVSSVSTAVNSAGGSMVSIHSGNGSAASGETSTHYFDDFYVNDETGPDNNSISDIQGIPLFPAAPGRLTQQTIGGTSPAATNWQSVNEHTPDDDVTYVSAASTGLVDLYKVGTLPANVATVVCVETILDAKTNTSGLGSGAQIRPKIGDGSTESNGTAVSVNTSYIDKYQSWGGTNPLTAVAWAVADFTTIEIGHERTV